MSIASRLQQAIRQPYNLLALASAIALSAIMLNPWPLGVALIGEVLYLGVVSRKPLETQSIPKEHSRADVSNVLSDGLEDRYRRVEGLFRVIEMQEHADETMLRQILARLQLLLNHLRLFLRTEEQFRNALIDLAEEANQARSDNSKVPRLRIDSFDATSAALIEGAPDRWAPELAQRIRERLEMDLAQLAIERELAYDPETITRLNDETREILRRTARVEKVKLLLINLHYLIKLIIVRFEITPQELRTRDLRQVLSDIQALNIQSDAITRNIADLDASAAGSQLVI